MILAFPPCGFKMWWGAKAGNVEMASSKDLDATGTDLRKSHFVPGRAGTIAACFLPRGSLN